MCECGNPVFGSDKITRIGYCKSCQYKRTDLDRRSIVQKAMAKSKEQPSSSLKSKIRTLHSSEENREMGSRQNLIDDIDAFCSLIVRIKHSDKEGNCACFTCDDIYPYKKIQAGHFISRSHMATRFDTKFNIQPQCVNCNCINHGNLEIYKERLEEMMPGITESLYEQSHEVEKYGNNYLSQLLIAKREELKLIENSRKAP